MPTLPNVVLHRCIIDEYHLHPFTWHFMQQNIAEHPTTPPAGTIPTEALTFSTVPFAGDLVDLPCAAAFRCLSNRIHETNWNNYKHKTVDIHCQLLSLPFPPTLLQSPVVETSKQVMTGRTLQVAHEAHDWNDHIFLNMFSGRTIGPFWMTGTNTNNCCS